MEAIKSLEERIKDRAVARLQLNVDNLKRKLMAIAADSKDAPSGVGTLNIEQAVEMVCRGIVQQQARHVCNQALEEALEDLAGRIDPGYRDACSPMPPRER